jgi:ABC-type transport system involved in cytochrome c biogenesis permease subunit
MLILAIFYLLYLIAWRIYEDKEQVLKITTLITIFGIINIPIIKYSVDWWNTLHQPASINIMSKLVYSFINASSTNDYDCGICPVFIVNFFDEI